jgi:hypothetical protein
VRKWSTQVDSIKVQDPSVQASCPRCWKPISGCERKSSNGSGGRRLADTFRSRAIRVGSWRRVPTRPPSRCPVHSKPVFREMSEERDPGPSSDQFDALIELLASDDACDDSNFHIAPEGISSGLRDANGKLDYAKIRSLFLQRRANNDGNHAMHSDAINHDPNSESGLKLPLVSTNLMVTEEIVYLVYFRLWWKNRQPWQETLHYPSLCRSEEISSLVKSRQFQRCVHFISHGTALGPNKALQGRRRSLFPIRPSPRGNFAAPLSTYIWMLIFGDYRIRETQ